jgi:hypothetical protein
VGRAFVGNSGGGGGARREEAQGRDRNLLCRLARDHDASVLYWMTAVDER